MPVSMVTFEEHVERTNELAAAINTIIDRLAIIEEKLESIEEALSAVKES